MARLSGPLCFVALVAILAASGCSSGPVAVTGTVTLDNKPAPNIRVEFNPVASSGRMAYGVTDESGKFTLTTVNPGDGAMRGEYKVTFTVQQAGFDEETTRRLAGMDARARLVEMEKLRKQRGGADIALHPKYTRIDSTPYTQSVPTSGSLTFALTANGD